MLWTGVAAAAVVLLPDDVCHRVPDGKFCYWLNESDSSVLFLFIQTRFSFNVPHDSTVAFTASICLRPR